MKARLLLLSVLIVCVCGVWAQGPNQTGTYYQNADGKKGEALRTALATIITAGHQVVSYDGLISAYELTDTRPDGYVRDWYSCTTSYRHGIDTGSYRQEGDSYNREHSVPQSWFSKRTPMKSDIVHVVPTDGYVNNRRSSYPFGEVNNVTYSSNENYCRLGSSKSPGYSGTVFEVADEIKGDMARIYFYMATRYKDQCGSWGGDIFTSTGMVEWVMNQMMKWSRQDPVDEREKARNAAVYEVQKNRNPFVDYPGLENYIWGDKQNTQFSYDNYEGGGGEEVPTVAMPVFTPDAGTYYNSVEITLTCATEGATIYYTTDGADASANSIPYSGPFTLTATSQIKAIAIKDGVSSYQVAAYYLITDEEGGENPEPVVDGEILLNDEFFGTSYAGSISSSDVQELVGTENGVTIVYALANGQNRYVNSSQIRLYPGNELRFSVGQGTITALEFVFDDSTPSSNLKVGDTALDDGKWTGNAQQVTVTLATGKHARICGVKVGVAGASGIDTAQTTSLSGRRVIYNTCGQRVTRPTRGIYIVDGKKVVIGE